MISDATTNIHYISAYGYIQDAHIHPADTCTHTRSQVRRRHIPRIPPCKAADCGFAGNNRTYDTDRTAQGYETEEARRGRRRSTRKIFRSDEGEYVRFEEIDVDITLEQERRRNYGATPFRMEEQISDAEWTDI